VLGLRVEVLVIDEAHLLDHPQLESIRMPPRSARTRPSSTRAPPAPPSPRSPPNDATLTAPRHPDDQAASGTSPTGPGHVTDIRMASDAAWCGGGAHLLTAAEDAEHSA